MSDQRYGYAHQRERARWTPLVKAGQVDCWRCGERIPSGAPWDLGHDDLDSTTHRGPEHQRCNRAVKGRAPNAPPSMNFAPRGRTMTKRVCVVCAADYTPSWSGQRTCGRACGVELTRRNRPPAVERKPKSQLSPVWKVYFPDCQMCEQRFTSRKVGSRYCSNSCRDQASRSARQWPVECATCGTTFPTLGARYCSAECRPSLRLTVCAQGHEMTPENTRVRTDGSRQCRRCRAAERKAWKKRRGLT